jgi:hypothetical protein
VVEEWWFEEIGIGLVTLPGGIADVTIWQVRSPISGRAVGRSVGEIAGDYVLTGIADTYLVQFCLIFDKDTRSLNQRQNH